MIPKNNISLLLLFFCLVGLAQDNEKRTLITNITIISANDKGIDNQIGYVVLGDGNIIYVDSKKPDLTGDYEEIDGTGKFLISGLMDSHVHLANTAGFNGQLKNKYPELVAAYFKQLPRSFLYHGFTTLVDVNNYAPQVIDKIKNSPLHPDIYTCGNQVQVMDDFMMEMEEYPKDVRYQFQFLHDKYNTKIVFPDSIDLTEHTAEKIINRIKAQNGVGAKIAYEDKASGLAVSWAKPSKNILSDLVSEAQKQKIPVLVHAPSLEGHQIALDAGVQIFAHGLWNWSDDPKDFENAVLGEEHKKTLLQISEKQSGYQLTFRAIMGEEDLITSDFGEDENLEHVYPKPYLNVLKTEEGQWGKNKIFGRSAFLQRTNPEFYQALRGNYTDDQKMWDHAFKIYQHRLNTVAKFSGDNGVNLILGSDTPAMNMFTNPPGYNGFLEMKHMFDAGIPLHKIFRAATFNNAKAFNLNNLYGSVEKNKIANLLILNSDPLKTINAYNDIETVIIHGRMVEREELSATNLK